MSELAEAPTIPGKVCVCDVAPNRRRGGDIRVALSPKTVGSTSGFMGTLTLAPGEFVAEHYHPYSEEFLLVVRGTLNARIEGLGVIELTANEGVMVPIGKRHRVWNTGDDEVFLVFHLSPLAPRPELGHVDTEELPGTGADMPVPDVMGTPDLMGKRG